MSLKYKIKKAEINHLELYVYENNKLVDIIPLPQLATNSTTVVNLTLWQSWAQSLNEKEE